MKLYKLPVLEQLYMVHTNPYERQRGLFITHSSTCCRQSFASARGVQSIRLSAAEAMAPTAIFDSAGYTATSLLPQCE